MKLQNTPCVGREMFSLLCGEKLGRGIGRRVFVMRTNPLYVVKIEIGTGSFQNQIEWEIWCALMKVPAAAKWLAPCISISAGGIVMIQKRTEPIQTHRLPEKMPSFMGDFKKENYGWLGKQIVCHDYGLVNNIIGGRLNDKMKKVRWHT